MKRLVLGLIDPSMEALPLSVEQTMRQSYLDYAMSIIMGREECALGLHTNLRVFIRRALGICSSPLGSDSVERCEKWRVWEEPKPSLIFLLSQKARAPPVVYSNWNALDSNSKAGGIGGILPSALFEVASHKFLLEFFPTDYQLYFRFSIAFALFSMDVPPEYRP